MSVKSDIKRILLELDEYTTELTQDLAFGIQGDLVEETPVDLGWAASNWWFGVGRPPTANTGRATDNAAVSGREAAQAATVAQVATYDIKSAQPIYITNGVPYIAKLNQGSSRQAPAMFVETIVMRNLRRVQAKANKRKELK